jgi:hypothetical protein
MSGLVEWINSWPKVKDLKFKQIEKDLDEILKNIMQCGGKSHGN